MFGLRTRSRRSSGAVDEREIGPYGDGSIGETSNVGADLGIARSLNDTIRIDVASTHGRDNRFLLVTIRSGAQQHAVNTSNRVAGQTAVVELFDFRNSHDS